jgi:hypothetical protein
LLGDYTGPGTTYGAEALADRALSSCTRFDLALGDRPSAVILVLEKRTTRMSKKHLQLAVLNTIHQQSSTDTGIGTKLIFV